MCSPHTFWTILFLAGENCSALSGLQAICHLINCVAEVSIDNLHSSNYVYESKNGTFSRGSRIC